VIEWQPGSALIGDFTWPAGEVVITDRVLKALQQHFKSFEVGPVEMVQNPKLKKPVRPSRRTQPRVWLPYEGPPLYDLTVTSWVNFDDERSSAFLVRRCNVCGRERWTVDGVEKTELHWDKDRANYVRTHYPRQAGRGLFVREADLSGQDIFGIDRRGGLHCTAKVKDFIESEGFTNVAFEEIGDTF
jgi:hypothetical protein